MTAIPEHSIPESDILRDSSSGFVKTNGMNVASQHGGASTKHAWGLAFRSQDDVMQISPTLFIPLYHVAYYSFFAISRQSSL